MAKYGVTHTCGHTVEYDLWGKGKDRESRIRWLAGQPCRDCEHAAELAMASAHASENDLPALTGSQAQIDWAMPIRYGRIMQAASLQAEIMQGVYDLVMAKKTAKYWIDSRDDSLQNMVADNRREVAATPPKAVMDDMTVTPPNSEDKATVTITTTAQMVTITSEKDQVVIDMVKARDYRWGRGVWYRGITATSGTAHDRAAEIGNALLAAGYPVRFDDEKIRQAAISGQFIPESTRWVLNASGDDLKIWWQGHDDEAYHLAKSIKGSRYAGGCCLVNAAHWREIEDLKSAGFTVSDKAATKIESYKAAHSVKTAIHPADPPAPAGGLETILDSSDAVLDDLKDD